MMMDIKRICQNPTAEDKKWFPALVDTPWLKTLDFAMRNFKDESFVAQYLSPKLIRDLKLFNIVDDDLQTEMTITAIHDEEGYQQIRSALSVQYNLSQTEPNIQVYRVDNRGDRSLTLRHFISNRRPLNKSTIEVLKHLYRLWGFKVRIESVDDVGNVQQVIECP